jgi:hypothetical protein
VRWPSTGPEANSATSDGAVIRIGYENGELTVSYEN